MGLVDINISATLLVPKEVTEALASLLKKGDTIMNNLDQANATLDALEAKSAETNQTLKDLATKIVELKASGDVQAGIDALAAKAQRILDAQTAAEDEADDQLDPPVPPVTP